MQATLMVCCSFTRKYVIERSSSLGIWPTTLSILPAATQAKNRVWSQLLHVHHASVFMPRCACAYEVYGNVFVLLMVHLRSFFGSSGTSGSLFLAWPLKSSLLSSYDPRHCSLTQQGIDISQSSCTLEPRWDYPTNILKQFINWSLFFRRHCTKGTYLEAAQ